MLEIRNIYFLIKIETYDVTILIQKKFSHFILKVAFLLRRSQDFSRGQYSNVTLFLELLCPLPLPPNLDFPS